jgi:peptide deformylase
MFCPLAKSFLLAQKRIMAILKIARMGHPVLLAKAAAVADVTAPEIQRLLADMVDTLDDAGGVGLAAPQVYHSLRLFIYHVPESRGQSVPLTAVFNPIITPLDDEMALGWEGCLSIPGLRAGVPRHQRILLAGTGPNGAPFEKEISGFEARIAQHETDHLDGILYPMRMKDFRYFGFNEETERFPLPLEEL